MSEIPPIPTPEVVTEAQEANGTSPEPVVINTAPESSAPKLEIENFTATHVKHLAVLMLNILQDEQVQRAVNWAMQNPDQIRDASLPLMQAFLGAGLQEAVDQLDNLLASLLDMSVEEFGNQDAEVYPDTIAALVDHPKFDSFLRSGMGMFKVIGSKWSISSRKDTAGQSSTSNP